VDHRAHDQPGAPDREPGAAACDHQAGAGQQGERDHQPRRRRRERRAARVAPAQQHERDQRRHEVDDVQEAAARGRQQHAAQRGDARQRPAAGPAARSLSYTPSAVSRQIAPLEREAGAKLVQRGPRGVSLTEPGRLLSAEAEQILGRLEAAELELQALAGLRAGLLRLGWFATAGATLMPRAIAAFERGHPGVQLDLFEGDPDACVPRPRAYAPASWR
jgi:hypothetical protein